MFTNNLKHRWWNFQIKVELDVNAELIRNVEGTGIRKTSMQLILIDDEYHPFKINFVKDN